ncbi:MAG: Transcriptional regulator, TetR family protein [Myxococcales bacterium]|nr:Transcriptional regulator, TetR family protein [Myxococcales bacterium]
MAKVKPENEDSPKREAILDAALELFAELGYHGTTVPQVADKAGVGAGTLYRYFENKEALVNALFQKWKRELARQIMERFPVEQPVRTQFHEIWKRAAGFATRHPRALDFLELHHHGSYLDAASIAVEQELLIPIYAFAENAKRLQQLKEISAEILGALVWGGFMGLVNAARKGFVTLDKKTFDHAEECMWQAIRR